MKRKILMAILAGVFCVLFCSGCACEHEYSEWSVTMEATCQTEGVETRACTKCEEIETRPIPRTEHLMGSWTVSKAPTCTEVGAEVKQCKNCAYAENREVATVPHSMGEWKVTLAATCTEKGSEKMSCKNCDYSESREIVAQGHKWTDATCTEAKICSACKKTEGKALGHTENKRGCCPTCLQVLPSCPVIGEHDIRYTYDNGFMNVYPPPSSVTVEKDGSMVFTYMAKVIIGKLTDGLVSTGSTHAYLFFCGWL